MMMIDVLTLYKLANMHCATLRFLVHSIVTEHRQEHPVGTSG